MLEVKSLSKAYVKGKVVIDIPEFCVEKGEIVGIFGANGCGKSTFLKCISGLLNYQGAICVDGNDISRNCQIFEQIGIMIETPAFVGDLSGRQNIQLFVKNYKDMDNFANYFGMDDYLDKKVKTYSIGMKQKLAIVLALTKGKKMILLDEPFNGLDILSINCALQALEDCKKNGVAVILTSHQLDISEKICDKSYFIKNATFEKIVEKARDVGTKYQFEFYNEEDCAKAYAIAQTLCSARHDKCQLVLDLNGGCSLPIVFERVAGYHVKAFHDITNSLENSYIEMEGKK